MMVLAKKAQAALDCEHFRAILLSSVPGKIYHRWIRRHLGPHLRDCADELQAGALPGIGTDALLLLARTMQLLGRQQRLRTSLLFFDVKAAFYRQLRQLVVDIEEAFLRLLHSLQVPDAALGELKHHLEQLAAVPASGASAHLSALAADLFRGSWFRSEGHTALSCTSRGTRPRNPRRTFYMPSACPPCIGRWTLLCLKRASFRMRHTRPLRRSSLTCSRAHRSRPPPGRMTAFAPELRWLKS